MNLNYMNLMEYEFLVLRYLLEYIVLLVLHFMGTTSYTFSLIFC